MLNGVQRGNRICIIFQLKVPGAQIGLFENHILYTTFHVTNIENFYFSKNRYMCHKAIDSAAYIHMFLWRALIYLFCNQQILVKIVALHNTCLIKLI